MDTIPRISSLADPRNLLTLATFTAIAFLGSYSVTGSGRHRKAVLFSLSLMVFPFLPATNLFFPVGFVIAERILYLPSMGFCMLVGYGAWHVHNNSSGKTSTLPLIVKLGLAYLLLFHAAKVVYRNRDWESNFTLYHSAVKIIPRNGKMLGNLGIEYDTNGNRSFAEIFFKKAIEVEPTYVTAYSNLGYILRGENRIAESIEVYICNYTCLSACSIAKSPHEKLLSLVKILMTIYKFLYYWYTVCSEINKVKNLS